LQSESGGRFGYQLTFFRRALLPAEDSVERQSAWGSDQVFMAHFALSDIDAQEHYAFERFSREALGLSSAQAEPYQVWLEDWQVRQIENGRYQLTAAQDGISLDLTLEDLKGPILHGDQGYSQKGPDPGNASYYYSQTRLLTRGIVITPYNTYRVEGLSWKDHEFSTSALSPGQVGWDWFSIQLGDGSEIMVFQIRRDDGSIDPYSSGSWISPQGDMLHLEREEIEIGVEDTWRSPDSGAVYPIAWRIKIPSIGLDLNIRTSLKDQEMDVSYTYWEGAVAANGYSNGMDISGTGYVEMTGYTTSMEGQF
jgi:predicted secreted hydrolase